jgi:hypothetical protein
MFVHVKRIGGYEYLYLAENVREGAPLSSASPRAWPPGPSMDPICRGLRVTLSPVFQKAQQKRRIFPRPTDGVMPKISALMELCFFGQTAKVE